MITRIWHGWTTLENANTYEQLLKTEIFPGIENKNIKGFKKINLLKRSGENETEFISMLFFEDLMALKQFAGEDYEKAYIPDKARRLLSRFNKNAQHYELII